MALTASVAALLPSICAAYFFSSISRSSSSFCALKRSSSSCSTSVSDTSLFAISSIRFFVVSNSELRSFISDDNSSNFCLDSSAFLSTSSKDCLYFCHRVTPAVTASPTRISGLAAIVAYKPFNTPDSVIVLAVAPCCAADKFHACSVAVASASLIF